MTSRARATDLDALAGELTGAMAALAPEEQRLAVALYRLLAEGEAVSPERLGEELRLEAAEAAKTLQTWPNVFYDGERRVVGFGGLALAKTGHRLLLDGRALHAWCAWDTLFIPIVLGREAHVESSSPGTGETVSLTVAPRGLRDLVPETAVLSFVRPPRFDADVIRNFCHHVHFFASRSEGEDWLRRRDDGFILSIEDGFELGRRWVEGCFGAALGEGVRAA